MNKPREFWINIDDTDNGDKVYETPQSGPYYVHVREVSARIPAEQLNEIVRKECDEIFGEHHPEQLRGAWLRGFLYAEELYGNPEGNLKNE